VQEQVIRQARIKEAPPQEQELICVEIETETLSQPRPRPRSQVDVLARLDEIGVCPANYKWNLGPPWRMGFDPSANDGSECGNCGRATSNFRGGRGYQCSGGTHFVCWGCVNTLPTMADVMARH